MKAAATIENSHRDEDVGSRQFTTSRVALLSCTSSSTKHNRAMPKQVGKKTQDGTNLIERLHFLARGGAPFTGTARVRSGQRITAQQALERASAICKTLGTNRPNEDTGCQTRPRSDETTHMLSRSGHAMLHRRYAVASLSDESFWNQTAKTEDAHNNEDCVEPDMPSTNREYIP
jgi:hypothetical protein